MDVLSITGGTPLQGTIRAAGAKNAMTKMLVASLLSPKPCRFLNVPNIGDVEVTVELCREIGAVIEWDRDKGELHTCMKELKSSYIPQRFSGANRIPILMIGALLGRTREEIIVPTVGGCHLGKRSVDFHVEALRQLGATIEYRKMKTEGAYFAHAHEGLQGARIKLPYPSVGATENSILAAMSARGTTVIDNAAMEPEVIDLILFLQKMGAHITVDVNRRIRIEGGCQFREVEHTVIPDRNEVASYASAAVATGGRVFIEGARHLDLITYLNSLRAVGGGFEVREDGIEFFATDVLRGGLHIETDVHPGFMTDWQQPFVVLLTQARGTSVVHETVYEKRFGYVHTLHRMGADVSLMTHCLGGRSCRFAAQDHEHSVIVKGPTKLAAQDISVPDLRAGFAYVMASLLAEGTSTVAGVRYLERGYENLVDKLQSLGAEIERSAVPDLNVVEEALGSLQARKQQLPVKAP